MQKWVNGYMWTCIMILGLMEKYIWECQGVNFQRDGWRAAGCKNGVVGMKYMWLWDTLHDLVGLEKIEYLRLLKCKVLWRIYIHTLVEYMIISEKEIDSSFQQAFIECLLLWKYKRSCFQGQNNLVLVWNSNIFIP